MRQALERQPGWPRARVQLAIALFLTNRFDEARGHLEDVIRANPDDADAHYQLGRLYMKMGKHEQARRQLLLFDSLKK